MSSQTDNIMAGYQTLACLQIFSFSFLTHAVSASTVTAS